MTVPVRSTTQRRRTSKRSEKYIKNLKSGAHAGKFLVRVPNGKDAQGHTQYKNYGPFADFEAAVAKRDEHLAKVKAAPVAHGREAKPTTFREQAYHWLDVQSANDNASSTTSKYRHTMDMHVLNVRVEGVALGDMALDQLSQRTFEIWREGRKKVLGPATVNYALKRIKTCLNKAGLKDNPAAKVAFVGEPKKRRESSFADYGPIVAAAADSHLYLVPQFTVDSGMRESEIVAMHWGDLDLDRIDPKTGKRAPRIRLAWHTVSDGQVSKGEHVDAFRPGTKTSDDPNEYQAISPEMADMLKAHAIRLTEHKMGSRPWAKRVGKPTKFFYAKGKNDKDGPRYVVPQDPIAPDALVFPAYDGAPLMTANISGWFSRVCERAGVAKTFHGMRHDCGSFMLADNVPLAVVSRHLRHAHSAITAEIYTHQINEQERMGADAMGARWAAMGRAA